MQTFSGPISITYICLLEIGNISVTHMIYLNYSYIWPIWKCLSENSIPNVCLRLNEYMYIILCDIKYIYTTTNILSQNKKYLKSLSLKARKSLLYLIYLYRQQYARVRYSISRKQKQKLQSVSNCSFLSSVPHFLIWRYLTILQLKWRIVFRPCRVTRKEDWRVIFWLKLKRTLVLIIHEVFDPCARVLYHSRNFIELETFCETFFNLQMEESSCSIIEWYNLKGNKTNTENIIIRCMLSSTTENLI